MTNDVDETELVCRFCGLGLDRDETDAGWHGDCVKLRDDDSAVDRLASHPMYGMFGDPIGYQQG